MGNKYHQAEDNLRKGDYRKALQQYLDLVEIESENAVAFQGASLACLNLERYSEAYDMANKALTLDPTLTLPHVVLAYVFDELGERDKSREEAKIALRMTPESVDVLCCAGILSLIDKNVDLATEYLERAAEIDPSHYLSQYNLAVIYQDVDEIKLFKQSILLFRLRPNIRNAIKIVYLSAWLYRPVYLLALLFSIVAAFFVGPFIILLVTLLLMAIYIGTGIFIAFGIQGRQIKGLTSNLVLGALIGLVGFILYFWATIILR